MTNTELAAELRRLSAETCCAFTGDYVRLAQCVKSNLPAILAALEGEVSERELTPDERRTEIAALRAKIEVMQMEAAELAMDCPHNIVQNGDSAECDICGDDFGWWCPTSPDHRCDYPDGSEYCRHCGEPDERK
jgi:hypothetical protein